MEDVILEHMDREAIMLFQPLNPPEAETMNRYLILNPEP
jgi:hypothetical protein